MSAQGVDERAINPHYYYYKVSSVGKPELSKVFPLKSGTDELFVPKSSLYFSHALGLAKENAGSRVARGMEKKKKKS